MISYLRNTFCGLFSLKYCCKNSSAFERYFLCFRQKRFSAEQAAKMITADAADADDGDSDLPADSGSEIEYKPEPEYTHSDTTDEEELADNIFNDGMVPCRGLRTRSGYRRPKHELIRKRPNSPNMKDSESRPVLKQVQQDDESDPDMDEPLVTISNSDKETVPKLPFQRKLWFSHRHSRKRWSYLFFQTVFK